MSKERLDILLTQRGLSPSREKAKTLIMSGKVFVCGQREDKAGARFDTDAQIELRGADRLFASRGGMKLERAISSFGIDLREMTCMDIGASTGGFTDCMLRHGAAKVYAVDVGYGQLAWELRCDPRVISMEKTNARYLTPDDIGEPLDFASADVSFISLKKILPSVREMLKSEAKMVCLIKPQFEAGRENVGKKGVVRDPRVHIEVIEGIVRFCLSGGFDCIGLDFSPIKGPEGNIEYLIHIKKTEGMEGAWTSRRISAEAVVEAACAQLLQARPS